MKYVILFLNLFLCLAGINAQHVDAELAAKLSGKTKFYDIYETVENHYKGKIATIPSTNTKAIQSIERQRKFWSRWKFYWENRQNPDGTLPNVQRKLYDADLQQNSLLRTTAADPSSGQWSLIGPGSTDNGCIGRVSRIAFHPSSASTIYIGTPNSGIWKTTNSGVSWTALSSYAPVLGVSGLVVSHSSANTIYALTGDGDGWKGGEMYVDGGFTQLWGYTERSIGVLKSTDGGLTWNRTGKFRRTDNTYVEDDEVYFGYKLVQDPSNAQILLAATTKGIFRTTDGGVTWNQSTLTGFSNSSRTFFDLEFKPGNSQVIYAGSYDHGYFRSEDNGQSFSNITTGDLSFLTTEVTRVEVAVSPANSSVVYLFAGPGRLKDGDNSDDTFIGVFRSSDGGTTFTRRANSPDLLGFDGFSKTLGHQSRYDMALAVKPTNSNVVITGGLVMWKSTDGGVNYNEETDYFIDLNNSDYIHPDIHDIAYNPNNSNLLYAATDGGIWVSSDDAYSWTSLNSSLSISQFYKMEARSEDGWPWGGTQDNGTLWYHGSGTNFENFDGGDGYDVMTDIEQNDKFWVVNKEIWTDGPTDENVTPPGVNEYFPNLAKSYSNEEIIYAGYSKSFISHDQGSSWFELNYNFSGLTIRVPGNWALESCPSTNTRIYTAGINSNNQGTFVKGMWRVDNLSNVTPPTYTILHNNPNFPSTYTKITGIGVRPNNSSQVWITIGGFDAGNKVYYSSDAGDNWINMSGSLPNVPINCVKVGSGGTAIIGTDIGVFFRTTSMSDWGMYTNGLPRVPVTDLDIVDLLGTTTLYASTFGRGIWKTPVTFSCEQTLSVNESSISGLLHYQASGSITSTTDITGGAGTKVQFNAGTEITLSPGFIVNPGSQLSAVIAPCNTGPLPDVRTSINTSSIQRRESPYQRKILRQSESKHKQK